MTPPSAPPANAAEAPAAQGASNSTSTASSPKTEGSSGAAAKSGEKPKRRSMTDNYRVGVVNERPAFSNSRRARVFAENA